MSPRLDPEKQRNICQMMFGSPPQPLCPSQLPLNQDVMLGVQYFVLQGVSQKIAVDKVSHNILEIWSRTQMQTIANSSVQRKVSHLMDLFKNERLGYHFDNRTGNFRYASGKRSKKIGKYKFNFDFSKNAKKLFDIANHIPPSESKFYKDQKGPRKEHRYASLSFVLPSSGQSDSNNNQSQAECIVNNVDIEAEEESYSDSSNLFS